MFQRRHCRCEYKSESFIPATPKKGQRETFSVLAARALHPERSLAEHYNPLAMTPELVKAHDALDREVDKAMGAARKLTSERQRQELLFANYAKLTNN